MIDKDDDDTIDWVEEINLEAEVDWSICPFCGFENEEDEIFCVECGTRLDYSTEDDEYEPDLD